MVNLANIKIWDNIVGYLLWREETETATFEYAPEFKRLGLDLSPIEMPISQQRVFAFSNISRETFLGLPGLFADSLQPKKASIMVSIDNTLFIRLIIKFCS